MRKKDWTGEKEEIVVGSFPLTHVPLNPLKMVYCGWKEGGMKGESLLDKKAVDESDFRYFLNS